MRGDVADEGSAHDAAVTRAGRARRQPRAEGPRHELLQHVVQDLAMGGRWSHFYAPWAIPLVIQMQA